MIYRLLLFGSYLFYVSKLFSKEKAETANIFLSTMHAYYTTLVSLLYLTNISIIVPYYPEMIFLSTYFAAHDIYIQHKYKFKSRVSLTIHHLLIIFGLYLLLNHYNNDVPKITLVAYNYLTEISTPFLNKSIMLYNQKMQHHINYKISSVLLLLTFFCVRVIGGLYFIYLASFQPFILLCAQISLTSLNYIWFYKLILMMRKNT
tara:strand:- start:324 stop:935 length:612 start_codon:yes stop_codon:yes gene_type:complete